MNIKITRQATTDTTLFDANEATALTLLRNHVRAIDDSEDDLLKIYLSAAIDYMQELSNRVLGVSSVAVYLDKGEVQSGDIIIPKCQNVASVTVAYRKKDNTYSGNIIDSFSSDYIAEATSDKYIVLTHRYPMVVNFHDIVELLDEPSEFNRDLIKMTFTSGTLLSALPRQYKQAALLLVGHYYNMREAENIGGITTEVKEGVKRLMQSVRQF